MGDENYSGTGIGFVAGLVLGAAAVIAYTSYASKPVIAGNAKVSEGYVHPGKLELTVEDLEHNGVNRTIMRYKEKAYVLREAQDGRPEAIPYRVMLESSADKTPQAERTQESRK